MKPKLWIFVVLLITSSVYVTRHMIVNFVYQEAFEDSPLYNHGNWVEDDLKPTIVFLGSSMTKHTIVSNLISENSDLKEGKTINLGFNAATPYEMYITFIKNKEKFSQTKIFFFSLEPWLFSKKYYRYKVYEKVLWSREEWNYYMPEKNQYDNYKNSLYKVSLEAIQLGPKIKTMEYYGYAGLEHDSQKVFKMSDKKEILDYYTDKLYENIAISTFQLEYLKKLKDEIEKNHSELILLYVPNHISYTQSIYNFNKAYNAKLSLLLNSYLGNTKQAGSFCPKYSQLKQEDFFDRHHLSHTGAVKFSEKLGNIFELSKRLKERKIVLDYSCKN